MTTTRSLKDIDVTGKQVLIRVDFNVPLDDSGVITDDTRIRAALPTIQYILDHGASVIVMSHLGRPKGEKVEKLSLLPCAKRLTELIGQEITMAPDCIGEEVDALAEKLAPGDVMLLENLRFYLAETKPDTDPTFAKQLASLANVYVNDAFGTAHRSHSSTATITEYFPGNAVAGFLMEKEICVIGNIVTEPKRPFHAIIGGAKVSSKIGVLQSLVKNVDALFIGGGMAYTFLKAKGVSIGDSLFEEEYLDTSLAIIEECKKRQINLLLPVDIAIAQEFSADAEKSIVKTANGIPDGYQGMSIGPKTVALYVEHLRSAQTIIWNGPLGVYEFPAFATETITIAKAFAACDAQTIVGGGDCVAAVKAAGVADKITHISTGGGATLEYLEFGTLPGIDALS